MSLLLRFSIYQSIFHCSIITALDCGAVGSEPGALPCCPVIRHGRPFTLPIPGVSLATLDPGGNTMMNCNRRREASRQCAGLAFALLFLLIGAIANAQTVTFTADNAADCGELLVAEVRIADVADVRAFSFELTYDETLITPVGVRGGAYCGRPPVTPSSTGLTSRAPAATPATARSRWTAQPWAAPWVVQVRCSKSFSWMRASRARARSTPARTCSAMPAMPRLRTPSLRAAAPTPATMRR